LAVGAFVVTLAAPVTARERPPSAPAACTARFERARDELVDRGFAPTGDKDTRRWLTVDQSASSVQLRLEMRTSADGAATFYVLVVQRPRGKTREPTRWRHHRGKYCCGEHADAEDHLVEHRWTRASPPFVAEVSIVEFEATQKDPDVVRWRELFAGVARKAADDCLAAAR
jgi:hypothetical protein